MSPPTILNRLNLEFDQKIRDIQKYREDNELPKFSYNQITRLYNKHILMKKIYNDVATHPGFDDE